MVWRAILVKALFILFAAQLLIAESLPRVREAVNDGVRTYIFGQIHPLARPECDVGRAPADMPIHGASLVFKRSMQQELDLKQLLEQQQNPASSLYHHWLSPQQFAERFGVSSPDRRKVEDWLRSEGLTIDEQTSSATLVQFSGTVVTLERAFGTEFHIFRIQGHDYVANAYELSLPAAVIPVVDGVRNLNTFRVHPRAVGEIHPLISSAGKTNDWQFAPSIITSARVQLITKEKVCGEQ